MVERARISTTTRGGAFSQFWRFTLVSPSGHVIMTSEEFKSGGRRPKLGATEQAAMTAFMAQLRQQEWQITQRPGNSDVWWDFQLARGDSDQIQRDREFAQLATLSPAHTPKTRSEPSLGAWWMWGLTILILLGLVMFCLVLAFTTQIKVGPA